MVERIATANYYQSVLSDLMSAQGREVVAQQQVSSGKIGNDVKGFGDKTRSLVATQTVKARVDGLVEQLSGLKVKVNFQQAALQQVSDVTGSLKQSLTDALASGSGDSIMNDVQNYFSQAVEALNTKYGNDYVFSGGQTQTKPFTASDLPTLAAQPTVNSFFQNGTQIPANRIDDTSTVQTGFLATDVGKAIMSSFQRIQQFQQSASGNFSGQLTTAQQTFLQGEIGQLASVVTSTTQTTATGGNVQNRVDSAYTTQSDRQTTLKSLLGDITDVNLADAASSLTQAQTAVQASAQVFLTLKSMSLLNYLTGTTG